MDAGRLLAHLLAEGFPVLGVSIGNPSDPSTWRVDYTRTATLEQKMATMAAIGRFQVPEEITRFQATEAIRRLGKLALIETALAAVDENADDALQTAKIAWSSAQFFRRYSPTLTAFAALLDLTDEQVDGLFVTASQIEA